MIGIILSTLSAHRHPNEPALPGYAATLRTRSRRRSANEPSVANIAASYSRYSSDLQDASSIDQQQRKCREKAAQDSMTILPDLEFADQAISGTKRDRAGLNAMLEAARAGRFGTLYFESLSRLARESVITMPMLKELVYIHRIRIVSVSEGIDSSQNNWELLASIVANFHEQFLKSLRSTVLRGQEEAILNDWSAGDWCFGYGSEPIPGTENGRRGRHPRPRMRVIINEDHAKWVRLIFHWFVDERRTLDWIARELGRQQAPKDHRSRTPGWHHDYVKRVLRNEKYIGIWPWGRNTNVRNPLTGQITQEERPPEEAAKWVRERPLLRLIDDVTFFKAAALLDESIAKWDSMRTDEGRLHGSRQEYQPTRHLLQGLIKCAACGSTFQATGGDGKYLGCSGYKRGLCPCKTRVPRQRAEVRLLAAVSERVFAKAAWLEAIVQESQWAWEHRQQQEPTESAEVERKLSEVKQMMTRLVDSIERGQGEVEDLNERLRQRQKEKQQLEQQRALLQATTVAPTEPPTREWIESKIRQLQTVLQAGGPQANAALCAVVGGRVVVEEATTAGRKRNHLVANFTLTTRSLLADTSESAGLHAETAAVKTEEVVVTLRVEPPWAAIAEEVKAMFDAGARYVTIVEHFDCPRSWVAKALGWWYAKRGLPSPDGRKSRARLKSLTLPEKLADTVKALMDQGLLLQEIASHLGCVHNTVTKAVKHWHRSRGLPVPDGRTRRKELNWKTSDPSKRMERQADSIQPKDDGTVRAAEQEESSDRS